ncbi:MAG TPA: FAD-binding oxidoreductase [Solirubrobacteraceae bacterium]|nr:FAD-binding oxidoreductase [Solirubrobacteraceae bacterium]
MTEPPAMRWWGWGDPARPPVLSKAALRLLREHVTLSPRPRPPVSLDAVVLPELALPEDLLGRLRDLLGAEGLRVDHPERVRHAAGRGYLDLVGLRAGAPPAAPDAIALPTDHRQLRALLELAARESIAVIPFGGGTSVVGGVSPLRANHRAAISLDTRRLSAIHRLDAESRIVTVGAGIRAPALEGHLRAAGLTLGHHPQSYEYVSLGGCVATRSSGQASSGNGSIAKMLLGLSLAAPAGDIDLPPVPATAAGPGLRELLTGSEGALGVIHELSLRVRAAPAERICEGVLFESFQQGLRALRALAQEHAMPEVARLSDPSETWLSLSLADASSHNLSARLRQRLGRAYMGLRGFGENASERCLAILGFEGSTEELHTRRARARKLLRDHAPLFLGRSPGEAWLRSRFQAPYMRDDLLTHGVLVETLETATTWSNLPTVHRAVTRAIADALAAQATPGIVMCHVSHLYETGASLYFTHIAPQREGAEAEQWLAVKRAATEAILEHSATLTHHHAVGLDHAPWLQREIGPTALSALQALKADLDPAAVMNPGKLLLSARG